jgi:ribosome-binding protein aMBF1 (putative translation factor)
MEIIKIVAIVGLVLLVLLDTALVFAAILIGSDNRPTRTEKDEWLLAENKMLMERAGRSIRNARLAMGMTQEDLGQAIGLSAAEIEQCEKGNRWITAETLGKVCEEIDQFL